MTMHVITPSDLKKFQVEHYSKLLEKPTSEPQEKFLKNEIKLLNGNTNENTIYRPVNNLNHLRRVFSHLRRGFSERR
jgi:hypothetical protein